MSVQGSDVQFAKTGLEDYVEDANEALRFKLVRTPEDLNNKQYFKPEMTHQIYGDAENIFGYKGLKIDLLMTADTLESYIGHTFDNKVDPKQTDGVEADQVVDPLTKILAPNSFTFSLDDFRKSLNTDNNFHPMGEKVYSFSKEGKDGVNREYDVFKCDESTPTFRDYHERLQAWIMFYIDAASYIDIDDDSWRFFLLFEKYKVGGQQRFAMSGYTTVYEYYAYGRDVNMKRPRISQMLVLPPFQKMGLGSELLNTVYKTYWRDDKVVDITVEDPSDNFVRLRDAVDTKNCMKLPSYSREKVVEGFSDEMATNACKELKLCKKQARRVYEIIRLHYTKISDPADYKSYRVDIKKRLNIPYQKEKCQLAKLEKALKPEEFAAATMNITNREQRMDSLHRQFLELEEHYRYVLERVAASA